MREQVHFNEQRNMSSKEKPWTTGWILSGPVPNEPFECPDHGDNAISAGGISGWTSIDRSISDYINNVRIHCIGTSGFYAGPVTCACLSGT